MVCRIIMRMTEGKRLSAAEQMRQQMLLMAWFSPSFPIGSFAFSHGLEWAQECGAVQGRAALEQWLIDLVEHGSARNDAILLAEAWRAYGYEIKISILIDLGAALQPSRELSLEANVQGRAFVQMVEAAFPLAVPMPVQAERLILPVAVGLCGAAHAVRLGALLTAYLAAFVANLSSAAVRLGIVGQTDGQRIIAALHPAVARLACSAEALTLEDLASAALRADLCSLQHETQYSRLFRS